MIAIALGANLPSDLGSPEVTLAAALRMMPDLGIEVVRCSSFFESEAQPPSDQPSYVNAVALVTTSMSAMDLLSALMELETALGRVRTVQNAARLLDLDLLFYNDEILNEPGLILPHPRMTERLFVLEPLCEIAPNWQHPALKTTASVLLHAIKEQLLAIHDDSP